MWEMYWLVKLDDLQEFAILVAILAGIASIFLAIAAVACCDDDIIKVCAKWIKRTLLLCVVFAFVAALIPSTKQMAAIIIVPKIANAIEQNDQLKQLPSKVVDLADAWITELKPKAESK